MSIFSLVSRETYDSGQAFPYHFAVLQAEHLRVTHVSAAGVSSTLILNIDYTAPVPHGGTTEAGGTVTLTAGALAAGESLTIERILSPVQPLDLTGTGAFRPENVEEALDRLTMLVQQMEIALSTSNPSNSRVLMLGAGDVDGDGAYEGHGNRIEDIADPVAALDVVNRQWAEGLMQGASVGVPTIVPPRWNFVSEPSQDQFEIPGALLSNVETYLLIIDGIVQSPAMYTIDLSLDPPVLVIDDSTLAGNIPVEIRCIGYARPVDPVPFYGLADRPEADISIAGMEIRYRPVVPGPTLRQVCEINSAGGAEWLTLGVTT